MMVASPASIEGTVFPRIPGAGAVIAGSPGGQSRPRRGIGEPVDASVAASFAISIVGVEKMRQRSAPQRIVGALEDRPDTENMRMGETSTDDTDVTVIATGPSPASAVDGDTARMFGKMSANSSAVTAESVGVALRGMRH